MTLITKDIYRNLIDSIKPERSDEAHKNNYGHVLIIAGSQNMTGACLMASSAALRSGAGLVRVFAPTSVLNVIRINLPCAMTFPMDYDLKDKASEARLMGDLESLCSWADSVLIGPGIDSADKIWDIVIPFFLRNSSNVILDASSFDVCNHDIRKYSMLISERKESKLNPVIMTPHQGEMKRIYNAMVKARLIDGTESYEALGALGQIVKKLDAIIVLKDYKTVISTSQDEWYSINRANSGMAKGGSGDVLSGLMTGMNAQFDNKLDSVIASVYFHSEAGLIASEKFGKRFMLPTDVIDSLSEAYKNMDW